MKHVLGIIGSPRKTANCELLIKAVSKTIPEPHRLSLLKLSDFHIKPCRGCYLCLFKKERCVLRDDFETVVEALISADGLIVAVPTYFLGANASLKSFLDRGLSLYGRAEKLWEKPALGIGISGIRGKEGYTRLAIESFIRFLLADVKDVDIVTAALPGEILEQEEIVLKIETWGRALFGPAVKRPGADELPLCPVCGNDTFRFLTRARVRCMLCSNEGDVEYTGDGVKFRIICDDHPLFLCREAALEHREWLRDQVKNFVESRQRLKELSEPFKDIGEWIKPASDEKRTR